MTKNCTPKVQGFEIIKILKIPIINKYSKYIFLSVWKNCKKHHAIKGVNTNKFVIGITFLVKADHVKKLNP